MYTYKRFDRKHTAMGLGLLAAACLLIPAAGAMAQDTSSPRDKLAVWAGHWKVHIDTKETQFGHAMSQDYDSRCGFFPHGTYMFCDYMRLQAAGDTGRAFDDIGLIFYSDVDKTFKYMNVAEEGVPDENTMSVDGNVWTRPFKVQRRSGEIVDAREIYTFVSADKQTGQLEISLDKGAHWIVVNQAVGTRQP